jgi:hypothetical protein
MARRRTRKDQLIRGGRRRCSTLYGGASPSATHARAGKRKDKLAREMSILPLSTGKTTSMPPRLSPCPYTLHHRRNVGRSLTCGPCTMQAHHSTALASLGPVKEEFRGRTNGQDQSDHPDPTVQTTAASDGLRGRGSLRLYFDGWYESQKVSGPNPVQHTINIK